MADRLDELLSRGLAASVDGDSTDERGRTLGLLIRSRAARRNRVRRTALGSAAAAVLLGAAAIVMQDRYGDSDKAGQVADARRPAQSDDSQTVANAGVETNLQVAALIDELNATTQLVSETVDRMQVEERNRQLREELSRYEASSTIDLAIDQTVALGLADARRLAAFSSEQASQRLARLVELFPESGLTAQAKQQLNELQAHEVMP